jgi:hypothetical protein
MTPHAEGVHDVESAGADEMVALARQHGKAVYFSLDEISDVS